jgi:hypothetical protein
LAAESRLLQATLCVVPPWVHHVLPPPFVDVAHTLPQRHLAGLTPEPLVLKHGLQVEIEPCWTWESDSHMVPALGKGEAKLYP